MTDVPADFKKIEEFTRAYHVALEQRLEARGRQNLPHHGDATRLVYTCKASDGFATFYFPASADGTDPPSGYYGLDYSKYDLNALAQSLHVRRLKIASPNIGQRRDAFDRIPPDTEPIPEAPGPWLHDDVRQAVVSGKLKSLPGMTISPIVDVKRGIRQAVVAARIVIWAPTFQFPDIGQRRLYLWTHADFWWLPLQLDLNPARAAEIAEKDLLAAGVVLRSLPILSPDLADKDTGAHAAAILDGFCEELLALLAESGHREETLHKWLEDPRHHVFLDPHASEIRSKVSFGAKVSDFVVRRSDRTYLLVEIERATTAIFRERNAEPTADFNHACQQVRDWQSYIRRNLHTVRNELNLPDIDQPQGMVVIGRSTQINGTDATNRWLDMKSGDPTPFTYDELADRVRDLADSLRRIL